MPLPATIAAKPYDWTYTTTYAGHHQETETESLPFVSWKDADPENSAHAIPLAELTRQDPILFYAEIPLYEDELHDNGSSNLIVRIVSRPSPCNTFMLLMPLSCIASYANILFYSRTTVTASGRCAVSGPRHEGISFVPRQSSRSSAPG